MSNDKIHIHYCVNIVLKLLISLCDLRGTHQFPYINKLDRAVGMAVQKMGPRYNYLQWFIPEITYTVSIHVLQDNDVT